MNTEMKIELLRAARELIVDESETYVCCAIAAASDKRAKFDEYKNRIDDFRTFKELIRNILDVQLQGSTFLMSWVKNNRPEIDHGPISMRTYRLRWIDEMIWRLKNDEPFVPLSQLNIFDK